MIGHLRVREKALEPFGWTGREAEWIALVCLHSDVFTRAQLCFHLQINRWRALRFVRALIGQRSVAEDAIEGRKVCRIFSRRFYRALGTEDIRHRWITSPEVLIRRLLSLDYVLEHPEMSWLPTESEKVRCFEHLSIPRRKLPQRVYRGAVGNTRRYFALKLRIAGSVVPEEFHPLRKKAACEDADVKVRKPALRRGQHVESVAVPRHAFHLIQIGWSRG